MTTIDEALDAFLAEQDKRLAERTYRNYLEVVELFRDCMNGYGYESLSELERQRWQAAFDAGDERAFTRLFGPEKIPQEVGQFLGWFVIRKVMAGQEFLKACGTVTKKLGKWLAANGYVGADDAADMAERGRKLATSCRRPTSSPSCCTSKRDRYRRSTATRSRTTTGSRTSSGSSASSLERCGSTAESVRSR